MSVYRNLKGSFICDLACMHQHKWKANAEKILRGAWCPLCELQEASNGRLAALVRKKGGRILSPPNGPNQIAVFACELGHEWQAKRKKILGGSWCPTCVALKRRVPLAKYQQYARSKGGKCLTTKLVSLEDRVEFQCKEGHVWNPSRSTLNQRQWCPRCAPNRKITINELKEYAKSRGGECLVQVFLGPRRKVIWRCGVGHEWLASPICVLNNRSWCPECHVSSRRLGIEEMKKMATDRGGQCLSTRYENSSSKLRWRCAEGHVFWAQPNHIRSSSSWCPQCALDRVEKRLTIEDMQARAKARGGLCISKEYKGVFEPLLWQCEKGHRWETAPVHIQQGRWCHFCARKHRRSLEDIRALAESRGGKCLAKSYRSNKDKLSWECGAGHRWEASFNGVSRGSWCPFCAGNRPKATDGKLVTASEMAR